MKFQWIAEYSCGCSEVQNRKKDLVGYCSVHGNDLKHIQKLLLYDEKKVETGLAS